MTRLLDETRAAREKALLDKISDLEKKVESGGSPSALDVRLKAIEDKLAGGHGTQSMTIYDAKGQPIVVPYDPSFMEAMRRQADAQHELEQQKFWLQLFGNKDGAGSEFKEAIKRLEDQVAEANKNVEKFKEALLNQQIASLHEQLDDLKEELKTAPGEGKSVLDFAQEAGANIREGAAEAGKLVKDAVHEGMQDIKEIMTNRPRTPPPSVNRSPQQIADIMVAENQVLSALGEKPNA